MFIKLTLIASGIHTDIYVNPTAISVIEDHNEQSMIRLIGVDGRYFLAESADTVLQKIREVMEDEE